MPTSPSFRSVGAVVGVCGFCGISPVEITVVVARVPRCWLLRNAGPSVPCSRNVCVFSARSGRLGCWAIIVRWPLRYRLVQVCSSPSVSCEWALVAFISLGTMNLFISCSRASRLFAVQYGAPGTVTRADRASLLRYSRLLDSMLKCVATF